MNDGGNLAMKAMIDGYHRNGWEVYLLSMNTTRHYVNNDVLIGLYTNIHAFEWMDINNDLKPLNVIKNYLTSKKAEHVERFYQLPFEKKLVEVVKHFKPDVIQMESVYLTTYLPAIRQHSKAITILRSHNVEYHIWHGLATQTGNPIKKNYFFELTKRLKKFERASWMEYDIVLAITGKDAYHMTRHEKIDNLVVAPFSMDFQQIPAPTGHEKWVAYHIGAMDWIPNRNGIRWFLEQAWPRVVAKSPEMEFYFAGRKMPADFKVNLPNNVFCEGEVKDASQFIADKKILIVPINTSGGIRIKIMEGMAAGKVVISTAEGIKGLEAKAGEHYLAARTADDFANAIAWCLQNKEAAIQMGARASELMREKFDQDVVIKKVIHEIEKVAAMRL